MFTLIIGIVDTDASFKWKKYSYVHLYNNTLRQFNFQTSFSVHPAQITISGHTICISHTALTLNLEYTLYYKFLWDVLCRLLTVEFINTNANNTQTISPNDADSWTKTRDRS